MFVMIILSLKLAMLMMMTVLVQVMLSLSPLSLLSSVFLVMMAICDNYIMMMECIHARRDATPLTMRVRGVGWDQASKRERGYAIIIIIIIFHRLCSMSMPK